MRGRRRRRPWLSNRPLWSWIRTRPRPGKRHYRASRGCAYSYHICCIHAQVCGPPERPRRCPGIRHQGLLWRREPQGDDQRDASFVSLAPIRSRSSAHCWRKAIPATTRRRRCSATPASRRWSSTRRARIVPPGLLRVGLFPHFASTHCPA